jgi:hypothetical protein
MRMTMVNCDNAYNSVFWRYGRYENATSFRRLQGRTSGNTRHVGFGRLHSEVLTPGALVIGTREDARIAD